MKTEQLRQFKNNIRPLLLGHFAVTAIVILLITAIDAKILESDRPSLFTFVGVGLAVSIMTTILITTAVTKAMNWSQELVKYTVIYTALVALVKFTLAPYFIYGSDPQLDVDRAQLIDTSNFNGVCVVFDVRIRLQDVGEPCESPPKKIFRAKEN